jgi:RNA polymerase sigma-70 factor (ECF subfamily)
MTTIAPGDGELLRRIVNGDDQAFTEVYRRHQGRVYQFALLMSGSVNIAEEVTQEVFLVLMNDALRYESARGTLAAYLCGIARNYVLRCLERERRYVRLGDQREGGDDRSVAHAIDRDDPIGNCARNEMTRLVRQAVLALPSRYREVVVLCDFQEMSYEEVALVLNCPVGTVNSRLHRGHALLRKKLSAAGKLDAASSDTSPMRCFA